VDLAVSVVSAETAPAVSVATVALADSVASADTVVSEDQQDLLVVEALKATLDSADNPDFLDTAG
jgi:hypothetical protein